MDKLSQSQQQGHAATVVELAAWLTLNAKALLSANSTCSPKPKPGGGETCNISWLFGKSLSSGNHSIGPLYGSVWGGAYDQGAASGAL